MSNKVLNRSTIKDKIIAHETKRHGNFKFKVAHVYVSWKQRTVRADVTQIGPEGKHRENGVIYPLDMFLEEAGMIVDTSKLCIY